MKVFRGIGARAAAREVGKLYSADLLERVRATVAAHRAARESAPPAGEAGSP